MIKRIFRIKHVRLGKSPHSKKQKQRGGEANKVSAKKVKQVAPANADLPIAKFTNEEEDQKLRENARTILQNERQKLNQNLIKANSQYQQVVIGGNRRSSTNECSRSVGTFGHFKSMRIHSDDVSSPNSIRSLRSSSQNSQNKILGFGGIARERILSGEIVKNSVIPDADNNSLKAKSMYHSLGSSYWHNLPQMGNKL